MSRDKEAFAAAMGRVEALNTAQRLTRVLEEYLHAAGYRGPTAIAGSYVRDIALAREPDFLTVYLDAPFILSAVRYHAIACSVIGGARGVPKTGTVELEGLPRTLTVPHGYVPQLTNDRFNQETFLRAVTRLPMLRINGLGATPGMTFADPRWDWDAYDNKFVIRAGHHLDDASRPTETIEALTASKYPDWKVYHEDATTGDILEGYPPQPGSEPDAPASES